jgi:DNA replication and repair protein RecF
MRLTHLSLTNFRNFARLDVDVPRGPVLLVGGNAQGKTSMLEAVYFLATFVSFHANSDRQLINFLAGRESLAVARIVADFQRKDAPAAAGPISLKPTSANSSQPEASPVSHAPPNSRIVEQAGSRPAEMHRLEVRIIQEENGYNGTPRLRKEVLLDGVKRRINDVIGQFNAVLFLPHMLRVVEGAPEERRRYLNLAMAQVLPRYAPALSEYNRALAQRNALLKQLNERSGDPTSAASQLAYWDEQLSLFGAELIYSRIHAAQEIERLAARFHRELTRGQEVLRLSYQPAYDPLPQPPRQYALPLDAPLDRSGLSLEKIQQGFRVSLEKLRGEEVARGMTTIGPHRDEMRFLSNAVDLGTYGSRGQNRTAVLSLKLAEVGWMKEKTGQWPVLLLDEVLAELDSERRSDLLARLLESEQAMLTTTDLDMFSPTFISGAKVWHIQGGRLERET